MYFQAQSPFCMRDVEGKDTVVISTEASRMVMNEQTTDQLAALYSNLVQS